MEMREDVLFGFGSSAGYAAIATKPANKMYFIEDTQEIWLGNKRYGFGKDISISIVGTGDVVTNISFDAETKQLLVVLGNAGESATTVAAVESALSRCVQSIKSTSTAIEIDDTDPNNPTVGLKFSQGRLAGNVKFEENEGGLSANVDIPDVGLMGVKPNDKVIGVNGSEIFSELAIMTENRDGTQYVILTGVNGVEISKFDASSFVKNGMLEKVQLVPVRLDNGEIHEFLEMSFKVNTASGVDTETLRVDMQGFFDFYTAKVGGGLVLDTETNEFAIANEVEANVDGLNESAAPAFGETLTLKTFTFDAHGLVTGVKNITFKMPELVGGSVGQAGTPSRLVTYVGVDSEGALTGEADIRIVEAINASASHTEVATAKAVYDAIEAAKPVWTVI